MYRYSLYVIFVLAENPRPAEEKESETTAFLPSSVKFPFKSTGSPCWHAPGAAARTTPGQARSERTVCYALPSLSAGRAFALATSA